jgi:hypothetical protein
MMTLSDDPNAWTERQLQECNDEETETCISVCDHVLSQHNNNSNSKTTHSIVLILTFTYFENLGRGRQTWHRPHKLPPYIKKRGSSRWALHPRRLLIAATTVSWHLLRQ